MSRVSCLYPSHYYADLSPFLSNTPVDIDGMLHKIGIRVGYDAPLPGIAEFSILNDNLFMRISDEFSIRQPIVGFIKSFLLSHYLINKGSIDSTIILSELFETGLGTEKDNVAFKCAADFLVPPLELKRILKRDDNTTSIKKLAKTFNVPKSLISIMFKCPYDEEK